MPSSFRPSTAPRPSPTAVKSEESFFEDEDGSFPPEELRSFPAAASR